MYVFRATQKDKEKMYIFLASDCLKTKRTYINILYLI